MLKLIQKVDEDECLNVLRPLFDSHQRFVYNNNSIIWATIWQNQQNDCAPSEASDQPGHPPSLIGVFACAQWVTKDPSFLHADSEDSDQTGGMPRLIWVFAGRTCHCVGFVMRRLIYDYIDLDKRTGWTFFWHTVYIPRYPWLFLIVDSVCSKLVDQVLIYNWSDLNKIVI